MGVTAKRLQKCEKCEKRTERQKAGEVVHAARVLSVGRDGSKEGVPTVLTVLLTPFPEMIPPENDRCAPVSPSPTPRIRLFVLSGTKDMFCHFLREWKDRKRTRNEEHPVAQEKHSKDVVHRVSPRKRANNRKLNVGDGRTTKQETKTAASTP